MGEGFDLHIIRLAAEKIGAGEVGILVRAEIGRAVGRDAGQREGAEIEIALQRQAAILDEVLGPEIVGHFIRERILCNEISAQCQDGRAGRAIDDVRGCTADLVDLVIVRDQAERHVVSRFEQQVAAQAPAITLIGVRPVAEVLDIAVALVEIGAQAVSQRLGDGPRDDPAGTIAIIIADSAFDTSAQFELRLLRHDRDHPGGCVLAEQRRLRPAQDFYTLQVWQVGNLRGRARAIDAVHENANRRLDAGIVGAVAEAPDDEIRVGRGLLLADTQRWHDGLQVSQIHNSGLFNDALIHHGHSDWNILQGLFALGGGDGHGLKRAALIFGGVLRMGRH